VCLLRRAWQMVWRDGGLIWDAEDCVRREPVLIASELVTGFRTRGSRPGDLNWTHAAFLGRGASTADDFSSGKGGVPLSGNLGRAVWQPQWRLIATRGYDSREGDACLLDR
jgi:hypothetical protein